jgi:hypothetical protein
MFQRAVAWEINYICRKYLIVRYCALNNTAVLGTMETMLALTNHFGHLGSLPQYEGKENLKMSIATPYQDMDHILLQMKISRI